MSAALSPYAHLDEARRERAERAVMAADAEKARAVENSPLARLARGETIDPLALTDAEFEQVFPAAVFAAVFIDMARAVERHLKGAAAQTKSA